MTGQNMTNYEPNPDVPGREFVIRPNRSMSWRGMLTFMAVCAVLSMSIAIGFMAMGAWMILPFAGLELLGLCTALYVCARHTSRVEVVTVSEDAVTVSSGRKGPSENREFQRGWTQIVLENSGHDWYPSRLVIRSHGRGVEVGSCLREGERRQLASALNLALRTPGRPHGI